MRGSRLDDEELLHLALQASNEHRHEEAISHLKQALEIAPDNAKVHYMLGAEHAEIGLYDRAVEEMARAVKLDPGLVTAQFQLGLLHMTAGRINEAEEAWKPLDKLGDNNAFYLFKTGMLYLVRDQFDACMQALEKGIRLNEQNEALNNDMRRILEDVKPRAGKQTGTWTAGTSPTRGSKHASDIRLGAYRQKPNEKD